MPGSSRAERRFLFDQLGCHLEPTRSDSRMVPRKFERVRNPVLACGSVLTEDSRMIPGTSSSPSLPARCRYGHLQRL